jgi:ribosomal protein L10
MAYPKTGTNLSPDLRSLVRSIETKHQRHDSLKLRVNTLLTDGERILSLNREEKKAVVTEVSAELAKAQAVIVAEYRGLGVGHMTQLRAKARQSGIYFRVLSREELLSQLLGTMQAPIVKFVRTLNEVPTKFVRGVAAVRDQKQAA